jgi:stalled ribosome alternative rescue factor ArfA
MGKKLKRKILIRVKSPIKIYDPHFRKRIEKNKKGRGSYNRKDRNVKDEIF